MFWKLELTMIWKFEDLIDDKKLLRIIKTLGCAEITLLVCSLVIPGDSCVPNQRSSVTMWQITLIRSDIKSSSISSYSSLQLTFNQIMIHSLVD